MVKGMLLGFGVTAVALLLINSALKHNMKLLAYAGVVAAIVNNLYGLM